MDTSNVVSIELVGNPEWPPCAIGEPADYRGVKIQVKYKDGTSAVVDVTPRYLNESSLQTTVSPRKSIIQIGKCRINVQIPLLDISLDHIEAEAIAPLVVKVGEWVDREKIRVHAIYSDGSMREVFHFKLFPFGPVEFEQDAIQVRYGRQQVSLPIVVYAGDAPPEITPTPTPDPIPLAREVGQFKAPTVQETPVAHDDSVTPPAATAPAIVPEQAPSVMDLFDDDDDFAPPYTPPTPAYVESQVKAPTYTPVQPQPYIAPVQAQVFEEEAEKEDPVFEDFTLSPMEPVATQPEPEPVYTPPVQRQYVSPKAAPVLTPKVVPQVVEPVVEEEPEFQFQPPVQQPEPVQAPSRPRLNVKAPGLSLNVVQPKKAPVVLTQVGVSAVPDVKSYLVGDTEADLTGGKLSLFYSDGHTEEVPMVPDGDVIMNTNNPGKGTVSFQYKEQPVRYVIDVYEPILEDLHITQMPNKMDYIDGDELDLHGMILELVYPAGITRSMEDLPLEGYKVSAEACANGLTLELGGIEFTIPILVRKPERNLRITSVELGKKPDTTVYEMGGTLDITGAELKVIWSDGHIETVPVNEDMVLPVNLDTPGDTEMIMFYRAFEIRCPLKVTPRNSNSPVINVVPQPTPFFVPASQEEKAEAAAAAENASQEGEEEKSVPDFYSSSFFFRFLHRDKNKGGDSD